MASRRLVPASVREALLGIPSDIASLERNYLLADDDLDLICHVAPMCGELKSSRADPWFSRPGHRATRAARPARR